MRQIRHGESIELQQITAELAETGKLNAGSASANGFASSDVVASPSALTHFDHLFRDLVEDSNNLLEESPKTVLKLRSLGETMRDPGFLEDSGEGIPDSGVPSAYTYFGQFVTHEIIFEDASSIFADIAKPDVEPISLGLIREKIVNSRSPYLDLDSVYGEGSVRDHDWMRVGRVSYSLNGRPAGKDDFNDLPRLERSAKNERRDRVAQIGDKRNDENLIISQMHVAFLRAHNRLINENHKFDGASKLIRQHYQHIVLKDLLERIIDPNILESCRNRQKNEFFKPVDDRFFIPLEFSAAAFRFGHSMVRAAYNKFNERNSTAGLDMLFDFTRFSGQLGGRGNDSPTLTEDWIIRWEHFVDTGQVFNRARRIDTTLVEPLFSLKPEIGARLPFEPSLAVRNLLRGYVLRLPTGQALARKMGITPLADNQLEDVARKVDPTRAQFNALTEAGFISHTPLWYYILAEAAHARAQDGTDHLGPVGSTIVAEVILEILRRSDDSILGPSFTPDKPWVPTLPGSKQGEFDLSDLLRFAGVL